MTQINLSEGLLSLISTNVIIVDFSKQPPLIMDRADALSKFRRHAVHAIVYCPTFSLFLDAFNQYAALLMQMRFDGTFAFPGGFVDPKDGTSRVFSALETAMNREWLEEMGSPEVQFTEADYLVCHYVPSLDLCLHLYCKELSKEMMSAVETKIFSARDYGNEVLGLVRVPLYNLQGGKGFPLFLQNKFGGNSAQQLLYAVKIQEIAELAKMGHLLNVQHYKATS